VSGLSGLVAGALRHARRVPRDVRVPLGWYLGVTLVVPCVNGAAANPSFVNHALGIGLVASVLVSLRLLSARVTRVKG
jgi:hypothetical protein